MLCVALIVLLGQRVLLESRGLQICHTYGCEERADLQCSIIAVCDLGPCRLPESGGGQNWGA